MGNNKKGKSSKSEKPSSPTPQDQTNVHGYPDWAMQAFYGPQVALPPYYNSAVASGHAPHPYMWGSPQPMMPPYGTTYAVYSHGGVYAHPAVPIGSQPHGPGIPSSAAPGTPLNIETPTKSSANSDRGLMKKLKGLDGLTMSIGNSNGNTESAEGGDCGQSQSEETEGSSDGSDGNTTGGSKRSREVTPTIGGDVKTETRVSSLPSGEVNSSANISGKTVGAMVSPGMTATLPCRVNAAKTSLTSVQQSSAVLPSKAWIQNERELKRERRKQSNRESARRSRLRKQADAEELARRVESLTAENVVLKSEVNQLTEKSKKLRNENAALMKKLKNGQVGHTEHNILSNTDGQKVPPSTENLLSKVNNSASIDRGKGNEVDVYEKNSNSGAKLHQLLGTSPRADAVAAG